MFTNLFHKPEMAGCSLQCVAILNLYLVAGLAWHGWKIMLLLNLPDVSF